MDLNEKEIVKQTGETSEQSKELGTDSVDYIEPLGDTVKVLNKENEIELTISDPDNGNDKNNVVLAANKPYEIGLEDKMFTNQNEALEGGPVNDISDNPHNTNIQFSDTTSIASTTDDSKVQEKYDHEPIDIDEFLDSLRTDSETGTNSEDVMQLYAEQQVSATTCVERNIPNQRSGEIDTVLLSDDESEPEEQSKDVNVDINLPENINDSEQNENIRTKNELNLNEETSAATVISLDADIIDNSQLCNLNSPSTEIETNQHIMNVDDSSKQSPNTVAIDVEKCQENETNEQKECVTESVNVLDLLLENQDLFGQVEDDISERSKESDTQSNDLTIESQMKSENKCVNVGMTTLEAENSANELAKECKIQTNESESQVEKNDVIEIIDLESEKVVNETSEDNDVPSRVSELNVEMESGKENKENDIKSIEAENITNELLKESNTETTESKNQDEKNNVIVILDLESGKVVNETLEENNVESKDLELNVQTESGKENEENEIIQLETETNEEIIEDPSKVGNIQSNESDNKMECESSNITAENGEIFDESVEKDMRDLTKENDHDQFDDLNIQTKRDEKDEKSGMSITITENMIENEDMEVDRIPATLDNEELEEKAIIRRDCLNVECKKECDIFYEAPEFIINHFHLSKRPKAPFVCEQCYDLVAVSYGELCAALEDKQPIFLSTGKYNDLVEVIDSSDEEEDTDSTKDEHIDEITFDAGTLEMIENELQTVIEETLKKVDIGQQMEWNRQILKAKIDSNEKNCTEMINEMKTLQNRIDKLYRSTYNFRSTFIEEVQSLDLTTQKPTQICNETYPPAGELKYDVIRYNTLYYSFRYNLISAWQPCKVVERIDVDGHTEYIVQFCKARKNDSNRQMLRKHLAYGRAPDYRLNIGTRVIACFDNTDNGPSSSKQTNSLRNNFFPGVIAEPLSLYTRWRYLVFFDDGWVQYVHHENIRVVCEQLQNVWELIEEPGAKIFIEGYVKGCKNRRPIVQLRSGQRIQTEYNGKWHCGIVTNVDGSLVQIFFESLKRYEWIYRGSTRLFPLYKKLKATTAPANRNEASIEYIVIDDDKEPERTTEPPAEETPSSTEPPPKATSIQRTFASQAARDTPQQKQREQKRAVAKKSTAPQPKPAIQHMNNSTIYVDEDKPKGKVVYYTAKKHLDVKKYIHHECSPTCLIQIAHNLSSYSPLSKPLLSAFERQICKTRFNKKFVVYRAPCGRRLRDMYEMHRYLRITNSKLNVDNFTFDPLIHCLAEYVIESYVLKKNDLSEGVEKMPVQMINCYDNTMPPSCKYSAKRIPTEGVNLNTDPEFLCGCDCTDDCLDKTKCACWKLTLQGAKYGNPDTPSEDIGYEYKRLNNPVPTGIYECNAQCKCKSNCLNRVVQHPLQLKLQVFKTVNRGWGLRCLNDVPKGSFICCYAGNLLTETSANEAGEDLGDEYFAELDYIEVVENLKEGYEPEVVNEDEDSSETDDDFDVEKEIQSRNNDSDDEFVAKSYSASEDSESRRSYRTRNSVDTLKNPASNSNVTPSNRENDKRKERNSSSDEEAGSVRQVKNFMASNTMPLNDEQDDDRGKSIRKYFGKNEAVYIMDAKKAGNIGRYFNHSCGPNLFVQNVFVDTHDLRFPWVAFFASTHIRAGTELTWNYNYEVGSVPGKVLICQCGDVKCRGRIL